MNLLQRAVTVSRLIPVTVQPVGLRGDGLLPIHVTLTAQQIEAAITREQSRIGIRLRHQLPAEALPVGKFQGYVNRSEYRLGGGVCRRLDSGGAETCTGADVSTR